MAYKVQTDHMGPWNEIREPFIVPTPTPYIIDLSNHPNDKEERIAEITRHVGLLRGFMAELGISEAEGRQLALTLNSATTDLLYRRAIGTGVYGLAARIMDNPF